MTRVLAAAIILWVGLSGGLLHAYSGGSGTASDPYRIASSQDLLELGDTPEDYDKHFLLTADIDLAGHSFNRAVIAPDIDPQRGAFRDEPFAGVFAGNNHIVRNLHIASGGYLGLFGYVARGAVIRDLGLEDVSIQCTRGHAGGLVGYLHGGSLSNCYSAGSVVASSHHIGGLVGYVYRGNVWNCYSSGRVSGSLETGGLVGTNDAGRIQGCYTTGEGVSGSWYVGGLVGLNKGFISSCYSSQAATTSGSYAGGLVGYNLGNVSDSYATGAVQGGISVGGLIGRSYLSVANCYSTGTVSGSSTGGLIGSNPDGRGVSNCFWDKQVSRCSRSAAGTGLTTTAMQNLGTFVGAGWDFVGEEGNGLGEAWQMPDAGGYPQLSAFHGNEPVLLRGQGTAADPYIITSPEELASVRHQPDAHYRLDVDLSLSAVTWTVAPIPFFAGHFDGNGHLIRNLHIQGAGYLGLFGFLGDSAVVINLGLEDGSVQGNGDFAGSLVGYSAGRTANCYSTCDVTAAEDVGGLLGALDRGTITNCYCTGVIAGNSHVGGLVGIFSRATMQGCYSTGVVSGGLAGGLIGVHGYLGHISGSVWDMEASGFNGSDGGAGLSTAEMMTPEMLALNGFANDPNWVLAPGQDYPRLAWEGTDGQIVPDAPIDWLNGSGTPDAPFEIETVAQLIKIGRSSVLWDRHFVLVADLPLDPNLPGNCLFEQAVIPSFTGSFDGSLHKIHNLHIDGTRHLGFFGVLREGASVSNMVLKNASIEGDRDRIGALAGEVREARITGCSTTGVVSGVDFVGGLAGHVEDSDVTASHSTGRVSGDDAVGGLIGQILHGEVESCYTVSDVSGDGYMGGLIGWAESSTVTMSRSTSQVSGRTVIGGLVGDFSDGTVDRCYSFGAVAGDLYTGGLVGHFSTSTAINCYSRAQVTGSRSAGGLTGCNAAGTIRNCYSTGAVTGDKDVAGLVGGGYNPAEVTNSFWDVQTSGQNGSTGGTGKTTAQMLDQDTYLQAGWDFTDETVNGADAIWEMVHSSSYPQLAWQGDTVSHVVTEDFESGNLSSLGWAPTRGSQSWRVTSDEAHTGCYSACAGEVSDDESSLLILTLDCIGGDITFFVKISCESGFDKLVFRIDGRVVDEWSGEEGWVEASFPVQAGHRYFEWEYVKDSSVSGGEDTAWIDDITFPAEM